MKKIILTFLLIALLCALCACNNDLPSNNDSPSDDDSPSNTVSCVELGGHDMHYQIAEDTHTYRCSREGCTYAFSPKAHTYAGATCIAQGRCTVCGAVGGELAYDTHVIPSIGEPCTLCGEDYYNATLKFELMADGNSYAVTGIGSCEAKELIIPAEHRGKPVVEIADNAFNNCNEITSVVIPDSVVRIGNTSFDSCGSLSSVHLSAFLEHIGNGALAATIIEEIELPDTLIHIGEGAFSESTLKSVRIPESMQEIGCFSFAWCEQLESVQLPSTLKKIGESAFACAGFTSIDLPDGVEYIEKYAFDSAKLRSITVPGSVEIISKEAFNYCTELTDVILEEGVREIDLYAFRECNKLRHISIPNSIETVNLHAFDGCTALEYEIRNGLWYLGNEANPTALLVGCDNVSEIVIDPGTRAIINRFCYEMEGVTRISIGAALCNIGNGTLMGLDGVTDIEISPDNPRYYVKNKCIIDRDTKSLVRAFPGAVIPDDGTVTTVSTAAFSNLQTIESIVIPAGVKDVVIAMSYCGNLRVMVIGPDVESVLVGENSSNGKYSVYVFMDKETWEGSILSYDKFPVANGFSKKETFFYSETEPTEEGKFWHYVNGVPTPWEK